MKITVKTGKLENLRAELLAVFLFQEVRSITGWLKNLNVISEKRLSEIFQLGDFKGELNETLVMYNPSKSGIRRIALIGLGKKRDFDSEKARQAFGTAANTARKKKIKQLVCCIAGIDTKKFSKKALAHAAVEGVMLSQYRFTKFKTQDKKKITYVESLQIFDLSGAHIKALRSGAEEGKMYAGGTIFARDLAANPGNVVTPEYLAEEAKSLAKKNDLKCTVFGEKKLRELKMNALLGVAQGSDVEPRLIILEYKGDKKNNKTVALVGKGVTFDTGGTSLKPSRKMEEMKYDMCGAAAVLGVMKLVHQLQPPVNVVGVITSAENMPGGGALKPGDVITAYSGTTIEVINTDAEGRLVLCDALAYVIEKFKPNAVVDIATLTGAVIVALGHYATGMLGNDAGLLKKLTEAGKKTGEMVWELPIYPEFDEHIKSDTADIRNSNGPGGGTIFGAAFLQKFVGKTPWVHLDIAGTAWDVKEKSYIPKGPTGVGVRLFAQLLKDWK
jgi:leucyl aminopeptidase